MADKYEMKLGIWSFWVHLVFHFDRKSDSISSLPIPSVIEMGAISQVIFLIVNFRVNVEMIMESSSTRV